MPSLSSATPVETVTGVSLTDNTGQVVALADVKPVGRWVLLYLQPQCPTCEQLLQKFKKAALSPLVLARIFIAVRGDTQDLQTVQQDFPELSAARWYTDPEGVGLTTLQLPGAPVIIGLKDEEVRWTFTGDRTSMPRGGSVVTSWLEGPASDGGFGGPLPR
jgi:hypothetical protein